MIWSMGPIMNRPNEHLGTADAAIIRLRRRLLEATRALRDGGALPPGVEDASVYTVRACLTVLPPEANWLEALADWHAARTLQHPNPGFMGRRKIQRAPWHRRRRHHSQIGRASCRERV